MKPKEFFLSLNKNGIPDEAWNYLQTEIIPDAQLEELTEISPYFREVAKALNTFYPDSLSESVKLNLKSILEKTEPKPGREPEPEPIEEPIEDVTLPAPEPAPEPAKPKTSKKEVKAAVKALTTALRYAKDKKKFNSIKGAIKALGLQMKYMKDGGVMEKGGDVKPNISDINFWIKMFKPRTQKWQKATLKRLKSKKNIFETEEERQIKINALKTLI